MTSEVITITPVIPPAPYVLADNNFVATLADFEKRIIELKVVDGASSQLAADLQIRLTKAGSDLEKKRKELLRPALDWQEQINSAAKPVLARIETAKRSISTSITTYANEQARIAAEAERKRLAEIARLERIAREEEAEAQRKAKEIADAAAKSEAERLAKLSAEQKASEAELAFEPEAPKEELPVQKTEVEQKLEALKFAPTPVAVQPTGVSFRTELRIASVDVSKLPDVFVTRTAKEGAIKSTFCSGWREGQDIPVCPGVTFEVFKQTVSTGRTKF